MDFVFLYTNTENHVKLILYNHFLYIIIKGLIIKKELITIIQCLFLCPVGSVHNLSKVRMILWQSCVKNGYLHPITFERNQRKKYILLECLWWKHTVINVQLYMQDHTVTYKEHYLQPNYLC